ncbi:type II CAAX prenyl endopeptidase Rce1 family protein [Spirochaetota bacterium]
MILKKDGSSPIHAIIIIVFSAILLQLIGRYYAFSVFKIGSHFYSLWVILRIVIPVVLIMILKIPLSSIGLGLPEIDRKTGKGLLAILILLILAFIGIYFFQDYIKFYSNLFHSPGGSKLSRFCNFMIFTSSTLTGWEFLHRGFLLMGIFYVLVKRENIPEDSAKRIAICIVCVFEVVFHFIKPGIEALGLLIGSPILSYIAFRTKSIWLPFLIHLFVELLFIFVLLLH